MNTAPPPPPARIVDGRAHAARLSERIAAHAAAFTRASDRKAGLAVVLVGHNPASEVYVRNKARQAEALGLAGTTHRLPADTPERELLALVAALNADPAVDGILVQLPLPAPLSASRVIAAIDPDKDVDGFHPLNAGRLAAGEPGFVPCTPLGCLMLLKATLGALDGREAVVIGRSGIVGKPMAQLLLGANATVTIAHSRTHDLATVVRRAEIVVAAVGQAEMVKAGWVKPGAVVIDVGINRVAGSEPGTTRLVGDVDFAGVAAVASAITPVPGGVGPMTIACLLRNTLVAAYAHNGIALDTEALDHDTLVEGMV